MAGVKGRSGGRRNGSGRKRGVPNLLPAQLKEMILGALSAKGGQAYLEGIAKEDPRTFCALLGRVLPMTVSGDPQQPVKVVVEWQDQPA